MNLPDETELDFRESGPLRREITMCTRADGKDVGEAAARLAAKLQAIAAWLERVAAIGDPAADRMELGA